MTDKFRSPSNEYRSIPFWSWNCRVTRELIDGDLDAFVKMGFGGVCIHPRAGLDVEYLGAEYMDLVEYAVEGCERRSLVCWLYDDDRFPSGAADGMVTKAHPELRGKYLLMSEERRPGFAAAWALRFENGVLISNRRLYTQAETDAAMASRSENDRVRFGYPAELPDEPWFEGAAYIDTTDQRAVREFIDTTHRRYYERLGGKFGGTVRAIFTDEPRMDPRVPASLRLRDPMTHGDFALAYTPTASERYRERYGADILDGVPYLIWECRDGGAVELRRRWVGAMSDSFVTSYMAQISRWCRDHNILFTGHILGEDTLSSQTSTVGEAMACYRHMDIPGIDVLVDEQTYLAAVQAMSVAEQTGKRGVMSELYGATDWDCPFLTYKLQGDWQAALGVTHRVPHLAHMSLEGEGKRDWPASIFTQSPWCGRFRLIEDHFARLNVILRRGKRITRVAILHPVEKVWEMPLCAGKSRENQKFDNVLKRLLRSLIDVQLISPSLLREGEASAESFEYVARPEDVDFSEIERYRDVKVTCRTPGVEPELLYQLRDDGERRWMFLCHTREDRGDAPEDNRISIRGEYSVRLWDTWTGEVRSVPACVADGWTNVDWRAYRDESVLLELRGPGEGGDPEIPAPASMSEPVMLDRPLSARLSEPNAFILDFARASVDGGGFSERMEILVLDDMIRARLGLPMRRENMLQPWAMEPGPAHGLELRYEFEAGAELEGLTLALERPEEQEIYLNGAPVKPVNGYFIDRAFRLVSLPKVISGKNRLVVRRSFTQKTNLEPMYILGGFRVDGGRLERPGRVGLGDLTRQGLPHYTGNVEYVFKFTAPAEAAYTARATELACPLVDFRVDGGEPVAALTTRPVTIGTLTAGEHTLSVTAYGSRYNLLSALHNADPDRYWHSPDTWRPTGESRTDAYMTKPQGILGAIEIRAE